MEIVIKYVNLSSICTHTSTRYSFKITTVGYSLISNVFLIIPLKYLYERNNVGKNIIIYYTLKPKEKF